MNQPQPLKVLTIGYAKRALDPDSRERARMRRYASVLGELHMVVFTTRKDGVPSVQQDGNLFLYATNARTRPGCLLTACKLGRQILTGHQLPGEPWVVSSQDPFETSLVGRCVARSANVVHQVQMHGDLFNPRHYRSSLLQRVRVHYGRYVVRRSRCIRVVSERLRASLHALGVPDAHITVLPIQADLDRFLAVGAERSYTTKKAPSFLYVGRFSAEKDLLLLLRAFYRATTARQEATLTLLGDGPEASALQQEIHRLGIQNRVTIAPWTNDVPSVMAAHEVFCLASQHEGWAMVLLEAAAAGMAVVTTDVGCAGERLIGGEHGQVVPVGDEAAYTAALQRYITEPTLVTAHATAAHDMAAKTVLPDDLYLAQYVEAFASCVR